MLNIRPLFVDFTTAITTATHSKQKKYFKMFLAKALCPTISSDQGPLLEIFFFEISGKAHHAGHAAFVFKLKQYQEKNPMKITF